jgi:hypothetical protein
VGLFYQLHESENVSNLLVDSPDASRLPWLVCGLSKRPQPTAQPAGGADDFLLSVLDAPNIARYMQATKVKMHNDKEIAIQSTG